MERDQFLARVKSAMRGAELPDIDGPASAPEISFADPVARFVEAAKAVDAEVVRAAGTSAVVAAISQSLAALRAAGVEGTAGGAGGRGASGAESNTSYIAWDDVESLVPGLHDHLASLGWRRIDANVGEESRRADHDRIGAATVGITGVDVGVAATGSLVLAHGPGRPRSVSLLVETHIAILPIDRIVSSLEDALSRVGWEDNSNIVAITGPSRTGDIESILTLGVHGPRHLHIVLVG